MLAKIYRPARNAMQSGTAKSQDWVLEFDSETPRTVDPLMGWIGNADTNTQVRMTFDTREEAIAFAQRSGIPFQVTEAREAKRVIKAYADNFSAYRRKPWTH
ncbi:MAG: hypothetical protein RIR33_1663 [Pseudomonadota bacterium]|jgi:hypothetical protein